MKRLIPYLLLAALFAGIPISGHAQIFGEKKRQNQLIEELMHRIDSLQQAYDSLYMANLSEVEFFYTQTVRYVDGI